MYYTDTELWSEREGDAAPDPGRSGPNAARAGERAPTDRPTDGTARAGTFSQLASYHGGRPSPRVSAGLGGEALAGSDLGRVCFGSPWVLGWGASVRD